MTMSGDCGICLKPTELCICAEIQTVENRIEVLVLQHPQEQDRTLGTARLLVHHLSRAQLKVGLSWPSLAKLLGRDADPRRWAVLYLGSARASDGRALEIMDAKGVPEANQAGAMAGIQGVVVLDGTWSQAKAMWWRNPWVLKCRRVVLAPDRPSGYGRLRREPRKDSLSTIESVGFLLSRLESRPEIETALSASFRRMLQRFRASSHGAPPAARDLRRRAGRAKGARGIVA